MGQAFMTRRGGGGKKLPELDLPAIASHIVEGYEAINGEGKKMVGTLGSNITKPATAAHITSGYQAINGLGELITGTGVQYYMQQQTTKVTSTSKNTAVSLRCTGSTVDLAIVWIEDVYSPGDPFGEIAVIVNGAELKDHFGYYVSNNAGIAGTRDIAVLLYPDDVEDNGDPVNIKILAFSH